MTEQREKTGDESERLRRCMSDMLNLMSLPVVWAGGDVAQISRVLLAVLPAMLNVDFVCLKLIVAGDDTPQVSAWVSDLMEGVEAADIDTTLNRSFGQRTSAGPKTVMMEIGGHMLSVAQTRFAINRHTGVLAAGSGRSGFPSEAEQLLLNVAGNQLAIAVNEAYSLVEQKHLAAELDERVAQRTEELAATIRALAEEVAERKRAENDLRRSEAFLEQAQRLTMTGSTWWNVSTGEIVWSDETYRVIEYPNTMRPTIEMTMDRCHPEDASRVRSIIGRAATHGADVDMEHRLIMPDGRVKHVHVVLQNVGPEPGKPEFLGAVTDITERKTFEERLRVNQMLLAAGERISLTGTFSWRIDTDERLFSDQLNRILGFEDGAIVSFEDIASRVHPEDRPLLAEKIEDVRSGKDNPEYDIRLLGSDGGIKHVRVVARTIQRPDGRLECLGAVQDITARRMAEEARDLVRSDLAHVTRIMSLGELTASIAHEVNQPLSGIITNAGTCLKMLASDPPNVAVAIETARRTIRDGNRAAEVIARLRARFRRKAPIMEPVDLNEAAQEVVGLLWSDIQKARVRLTLELADDLPRVAGDRVQLQQVIMNLMRNAMDAMEEIENRPRHLVVRTTSDAERQVRMSVRDTGRGFGARDPETLFNAFYSTKHEGMGIGLSVSRSIVESHEGRIWAKANEGPGTTVEFWLPQGLAASVDISCDQLSRAESS